MGELTTAPLKSSLFERSAHLERLNELLSEASHGAGHMIAILGEAGIGKTALTNAFIEDVQGNTARVIYGACEDLAVPEPLGPVYDLARELDIDIFESLNAHSSRLALYSHILSTATNSDSVSLIVIEDIHWADDATVDFLRYIARRLHRTNAVVLLTGRTDSTHARAIVSRVCAPIPADQIVRLELAPLSEETVTRMVASSNQDIDNLFETTGGNPLYVSELLRHGQGHTVPATIKDSIGLRFSSLPTRSQKILEAVSIFPAKVEIELIAQLSPGFIGATLDDMLRTGFVSTDGIYLSFFHEIVRRVVEVGLTQQRRIELNALALKVLREREPERVTRYIHHAREARDEASLMELAPNAARTASQAGARREATEYYRLALQTSQQLSLSEQGRLFQAFSQELALLGRVDDSITAQITAIEHFRQAGDAIQLGTALRLLSRVEFPSGLVKNSEIHALEAVAILEKSDGAELIWAKANVGHTAGMTFNTDKCLQYTEPALAYAQANEDHLLYCFAMGSVALKYPNNREAGEALFDRAISLAKTHDFQSEFARLFCIRGVLRTCMWTDYRGAKETYVAGKAHCTEWELEAYYCYMSSWHAELLVRTGEWDDAEALAHASLARISDWKNARQGATIAMALLQLRRGDTDAEKWAIELDEESFYATGLRHFTPIACLAAERAWLGVVDKDKALKMTSQALEMSGPIWAKAELLFWRQMLAPDTVIPDLTELQGPYAAFLSGDWRTAASQWELIGAPYQQALALLAGTEDAKIKALELMDGLGAKAVSAHLRRHFRAQGMRNIPRGPSLKTTTNPAGLTKRQMSVLELVAQGLSNAQIAEKIFISPKTVDHHVSAILGKLHVSSRGAAAARARELNLL